MSTMTCPRCGCRFETAARTSTRCRRCKTVVRVPAAVRSSNSSRIIGSAEEHTFGVVLLSCGHPAFVIIHPGRSIAATLKRYEWECPDTGATVTPARVLRVLPEAEYESMGQEELDLLISGQSVR
jgi:hypothetical protein